MRVGSGGRVLAFEPHPEVHADLERHLAEWRSARGLTWIESRRLALSDRDDEGFLHVPDDFAANRGLSSLERTVGTRALPVSLRRLDGVLGPDERVGVMKMDVEGAELSVLRGAPGLLGSGRIRDIVFEDHDPYPSAVCRHLEAAGYQIFTLRLRLGGLEVRAGAEPARPLRAWDSPSFLATRDPGRARERLGTAGWHCLRARS